MGLYAHAAHLHTPDKETGKFLAGSLLRSPHSLVIATPYGDWLNVYLGMGLSYKDVPELPTAAYVELNVYDSEGFDLRLYKADRLSYLFESGCGGDVTEQEERLLEIAADLWKKEHPDAQRQSVSEIKLPDGEAEAEKDTRIGQDFWSLDQSEQDKYLARARDSGEFEKFQHQTEEEASAPDPSGFEELLPEGKTLDELRALLNGAARRLHGPPSNSDEKAALRAHMDGKEHSDKAEDYVAAIARFLGLRGSLWSLEAITEKLGDKIDRRIVPIDALDEAPAPKTTE